MIDGKIRANNVGLAKFIQSRLNGDFYGEAYGANPDLDRGYPLLYKWIGEMIDCRIENTKINEATSESLEIKK